MVLELKILHDPTLASYVEMWPVFVSYAVSFCPRGVSASGPRGSAVRNSQGHKKQKARCYASLCFSVNC